MSENEFAISLDTYVAPDIGEPLSPGAAPPPTAVPTVTPPTPPPSVKARTPTAPKKAPPSPKAPTPALASGRDVQMLISEIKRMLIEGESDLAIAETLSLGKAEYRRMKAKVYDQEVDGFSGKSAEEQYVDYCFEQQKCLDSLDELIRQSASSNQHNAMVGAIRAKSQIMEQIHKTGVSMGIIKKEADMNREIGGIRVADLENDDVRDMVATELRKVQHAIDKFGDKPMTEVEAPSPIADPGVKRVKQ
jgi:hypothetical protein